MAANTGLTSKAQFTISAREVDFVTRFQDNWDALMKFSALCVLFARLRALSLYLTRLLLTELLLAAQP